MASFLQSVLDWLRSLFFSRNLEVCIVGLQGAGKTSLVNVLANGQFTQDVVPTVGFNLRNIRKGGVQMKLWDIGGQPRFRSMWERYCQGVSAIVFVVDSSLPLPDKESAAKSGNSSNMWHIASDELHTLIQSPVLAHTPLLVLATKNDLPSAATTEDVIRALDLREVRDREVSCYSISSKNQTNIDVTLDWLCARSTSSFGRW